MQGNLVEAIQLSEQALDTLEYEKTFFRSLAADNLGMAHIMLGDSTAAAGAFEQAVTFSEQSGNVMMTVSALSNLAGLLVLQGKLKDASKAYHRILNLSDERLGKGSPLTGKAHLGLGMLAREWNNLEDALYYYDDASRMLEQSVEIGLPIAYLSIAKVKQSQRACRMGNRE